MTSPPSPPKRRRRRIVAAIAALLLVSMLAWWFWPRGDARFVGKWERFGGGEAMVLRSNGTAYFIYGSSTSRPDEMDWSVDGDQLVLGAQSKQQVSFLRFITPVYRMMTGKMPYAAQNRLQVMSVTQDELLIAHPRGYAMTFWRIAE